jgi:signal transduction histidine kinase
MSEVTMSVTDNGPGIDPIRRDDVFQPFFTTKPAEGGKGLGLFIAREVARYHKAELELSEVESDSGALNTFVLHLGKVIAQ